MIAVAIFVLAYLLIAFPNSRLLPVGRAGAALIGAVAMVSSGALALDAALAAISGETLLLLFGMMVLSDGLIRAGALDWLAARTARRPGPVHAAAARRFLVVLSVGSAVLSAFLVNDTICLVFTPAVVLLCERLGLAYAPYLLALASSANVGSAATLVGNPQNMLIGSMSGLPFGDFFWRSLPAVVVALALNIALLLWLYRGSRLLRGAPKYEAVAPPSAMAPFPIAARLPAAIFVGVVAAFFAGVALPLAAIAGAAALVLLQRQDADRAVRAVDWPLLVFFAGLFVLVEGLRATGLVDAAFGAVGSALVLDSPAGVAAFTAFSTAGSNIVSNVPLVAVLGPSLGGLGGSAGVETAWVLLAFTSTIAGNLTLVGSVANLIVAEKARTHYTLGFIEFLRFGLVSTLLSLLVGVPLLFLF